MPSFFKHWARVVYALVPGAVFLFKGSRVPLHLSVSADSTSCEAWEGFSNDSYFHGYFHNFSYKKVCALSNKREHLARSAVLAFLTSVVLNVNRLLCAITL